MKPLKIILIASIIVIIDAMPSCNLHGAEKKELICSSCDTDYELKKGLVSDYSNVKSISLKACKITKVHCKAFTGLPSLESIDLAENKIHELMNCVLNELPQVKSINLTNNKIADLSLGVFDKVPNVEALYLKGNKLRQIQPLILQTLAKLKTLDLSNNALSGISFSSHIFDNNKDIKYLDLSRNDISGTTEDLLEEFQSLQYLYLDRCFLTQVPSFATKRNLNTLKHLILSTNLITSLDDPTTFINLDDLELLNFDSNAIESVSEHIFMPLKKLKSIVFRHNKLKQIPEKLFQNMPMLVNIDMSYNVIENIKICSFRNTPMKNLNLSGNKLTYLPDNFYGQLVASGGKLKKFLFNSNPWRCGCLRDIVAEMKANDVQYNDANYDGKQPICVADNNFDCKRE